MSRDVKLELSAIRHPQLKIREIFRNEALLEQLDRQAQGQPSLPEADACYTTPLYFPHPGPQRPYIYSSLVLSADGKMAFMDNPVGPLIARCNYADPVGGSGDFWCLNLLRAYADGLLIGANTLRNEPDFINYCMDQTLFQQRRDVLKKPDQPWQIIVSLDGTDIPFDHKTFHIDPAERARVMIATSPAGWEHIRSHSSLKHQLMGPFADNESIEKTPGPAWDAFDCYPVLVTGEGAVPNMQLMLHALRCWGLELLCAESPTYCGALMEEGCLDEYFLNYSMLYAGGSMGPGTHFPKSWKKHPHANLVSIGIHDSNFIYTRQLLRYDVQAPND